MKEVSFGDIIGRVRNEVLPEADRLSNYIVPYGDVLFRHFLDAVKEFRDIDLANDEKGGLVANVVASDFRGVLRIRSKGDEQVVLEVYRGTFAPLTNLPIVNLLAGIVEVDREAGLYTYKALAMMLDPQVFFGRLPQSEWLKEFADGYLAEAKEFYGDVQPIFRLQGPKPSPNRF